MAKVSIVFEETDNAMLKAPEFNVYIDGLTDERRKELTRMTPAERRAKASTAEFWAFECFQIVGQALRASGALSRIIPR